MGSIFDFSGFMFLLKHKKEILRRDFSLDFENILDDVKKIQDKLKNIK